MKNFGRGLLPPDVLILITFIRLPFNVWPMSMIDTTDGYALAIFSIQPTI
jgi:hypothetical protein